MPDFGQSSAAWRAAHLPQVWRAACRSRGWETMLHITLTAPSQDQMEPKRVITLKPFKSQPLPLRPTVITALAATRQPPARRTGKCASTFPPEPRGSLTPSLSLFL